MDININNDDVNLDSIKNNNQNDEFIQLDEKKSKKQKATKTNEPKQIDNGETMDGDDLVYKNQLIKKISVYKKVFHEFLSQMNFNSLDKKSVDELEFILTDVKNIVSNRNIENNISGLVSLVPVGIENLSEHIGLDLKGYAQVVNSNKEYHYCMMECLIETNIMDNIKVDPKTRLMYILGSSAFLVHTINSQNKEHLKKKMSTNIDPNSYKDI